MLLGQKTLYKDIYDKSLLYPIKRTEKSLPIKGFDIWNCYELSWLNQNSMPIVRILEFIVDANSANIVESKSVKLYLNSFHNTKFVSQDEVLAIIQKDLSEVTGTNVIVKIKPLKFYTDTKLSSFEGINLDLLNIKIDDFSPKNALLKLVDNHAKIHENLYTNLFKANCLVTGQPDWASVQISYYGKQINHESLLQYLISFRNHNEFAEPCAEKIFTDIMASCEPQELTVYMRFTRRGGIDINPVRSTRDLNVTEISNSRHARQ